MIWTPDANTAQITSSQLSGEKKRAFLMHFKVPGLNPGNQFTLFVNNQDMSYAARQIGKRMGDDMIVGQDGTLEFQFFGELQSGGVIARPNTIRQHLFELRDNLGLTRSLGVVPQLLTGRGTINRTN